MKNQESDVNPEIRIIDDSDLQEPTTRGLETQHTYEKSIKFLVKPLFYNDWVRLFNDIIMFKYPKINWFDMTCLFFGLFVEAIPSFFLTTNDCYKLCLICIGVFSFAGTIFSGSNAWSQRNTLSTNVEDIKKSIKNMDKDYPPEIYNINR